MKKILVLTGSPRAKGATEKLAAAFEQGAQAAGHEVVRFDAGKAHINGCLGCNGCWGNDHACCHEDGFWALEPLLDTYRQIAEFEGWTDRGTLVAGGFGAAGIESTDALARAEALGRSF